MRITNWKHLPWFLFVCLATIAAGVLYLGNFHPHRLPAGIRLPPSLIQTPTEHHTVGGTPLGLAYGAISLGIFVFAALLSLRKKIPLWRIGTVQRWLRAHIWLTFLTIPLIILHSGFRLGGQMTTLLMVLYAVVMVSGIYGLILQHLIPRLMKERLPAETVFEQIPHIRSQLCVAAEKMRDSFKPAPPKTAAAVASAPVQAKAAATTSAVMASMKGDLSTPTARPKSASGSALTAAPVTGAATPSSAAPVAVSAEGSAQAAPAPVANASGPPTSKGAETVAAPKSQGKNEPPRDSNAPPVATGGAEAAPAPAANAAEPQTSKAAETVVAPKSQEKSEPPRDSNAPPVATGGAEAAPAPAANAAGPQTSKVAETVVAPKSQGKNEPPRDSTPPPVGTAGAESAAAAKSGEAAPAKPAPPPASKPATPDTAKPSPAAKSTATPAAKPAAAKPSPVAKPAAAPVKTPAPPPDPASEAMLVEFIDRQILPYLRARRGERFRLGKARFSDDTFRFVKLGVSETYRSRVEEIQGWCDERRLLDLQTRLQHWLHGWLLIHVPFSLLLLLLTIWHAYVTLFYY